MYWDNNNNFMIIYAMINQHEFSYDFIREMIMMFDCE